MDNCFWVRFLRQAGGVHLLLALLTASSVLHSWDARREAAWAASDPVALRALYVPRSSAAESDVRLLRDYTRHRLVVRRIETQVFALQVLHSDSRHLRLRVVDRVAGGTLGSLRKDDVLSRRVLGTTRPKTRVITFRRAGATWQVVSVREPTPRR